MGLLDVQRAAVSLFARQGYAATGIRELGRAVGINSATLYHYAGAKEDILAGIMRTCLEEMLAAARTALDSTSDPAAQLARLVSAHVGLSALNPLTARVTDQEVRSLGPRKRQELLALRDDYESLFTRLLERGARTGDFTIGDVAVTRLALLEMCNGVANWYSPGGRLSVTQVQDQFASLAARLVAGRPVIRQSAGDWPEPVRLPTEPPPDTADTKEATA